MKSGEMIASIGRLGSVSNLTCPECNGTLWELNDPDLLRYRCHVGHAFSADSLDAGQARMLETALWSALRALEEKMVLSKRMSERARKQNRTHAAQNFEKRARLAEEQSTIIREVFLARDQRDEVSNELGAPDAPTFLTRPLGRI